MNLGFKIAGVCMFVLGLQMITPRIATSTDNVGIPEQPCLPSTASKNFCQELQDNSQQKQNNQDIISKDKGDDDAPKSDDGTATRA
ncbi:MAG: hypothetical protein VKL59_03530 [Nostocaceae cyanobacterium]|nr:hypothetical protein [Nostocaceae cyanobacterium]